MDAPSSHRCKHSSNGSRRRRSSRTSTSRDDDRKDHRHRKSSRKRRHHHSRGHSPSPSPPERRPPVVYMNPAFQQVYGSAVAVTGVPGMPPVPGVPGVPGMSTVPGVPGVGPVHGVPGVAGVPPAPAQPIDYEMRASLLGQLSANEQRISSLESELRAAQLARGRAEQSVFDVNADKLRLEAHTSELMQVMKTLECGVEDLQKQVSSYKAELERKKRENENLEKSLSSCKEQNAFLNDRNIKLVKKCEELTCENKAMHNRRDESAKELADVKPRIDGLQAELRQRNDESRKIMALVRSFEEKERYWKKEKMDLEKRIEIKNAVATAERKNNEEWKRKQLAERAELERKLKLATPEVTRALDAEEIIKSIEDIRAYYEEKVKKMIGEVEKLKHKSRGSKNRFVRKAKAVSASRISVDEHFPPAVTSSPPSSSTCRPSSAPPLSYTNGVAEVLTDSGISDD